MNNMPSRREHGAYGAREVERHCWSHAMRARKHFDAAMFIARNTRSRSNHEASEDASRAATRAQTFVRPRESAHYCLSLPERHLLYVRRASRHIRDARSAKMSASHVTRERRAMSPYAPRRRVLRMVCYRAEEVTPRHCYPSPPVERRHTPAVEETRHAIAYAPAHARFDEHARAAIADAAPGCAAY